MQFERPLLLLLLPLAFAPLLALRRRRRHVLRLAVPAEALEQAPSWRVRLLWLPHVLSATAIACSVAAAAGPYAGAHRQPDRSRARDVALAVDTSESMRAMDFRIEGRPASRMDAALRLAGDFIAAREGDRIAIVAFGSRAVTQCPLTFDLAVARNLLGHVEPEMLGKRTALGEGVALGVARLRQGGALVLISDGENTAGTVSPAEAARAARERSVKVYAIGIGSEGPAPVPARLPSGRVRMAMKDYALDEQTLRQVAEDSGGRYFRATDAGALREVFREIDALEQRPLDAVRVVPAGRRAHYAALTAAGALTLLLVLSSVFLRTAPRLR